MNGFIELMDSNDSEIKILLSVDHIIAMNNFKEDNNMLTHIQLTEGKECDVREDLGWIQTLIQMDRTNEESIKRIEIVDPVTAMNDTALPIGKRLSMAMMVRGISSSSLARMIGARAGTIEKYIDGSLTPQVKTWYKITKALNFVPNMLIVYDQFVREEESYDG